MVAEAATGVMRPQMGACRPPELREARECREQFQQLPWSQMAGGVRRSRTPRGAPTDASRAQAGPVPGSQGVPGLWVLCLI